MLRSLPIALLALAITACEPDLPQTQPSPVVTAEFDPTTATIPLPNDLVFFNPVNGVCPSGTNTQSATPACAQAELLASFSHGAPANAPALAGEFPSDQEVAITIEFTQTNFGDGTTTQVAPDLDLKSITPSTFALAALTPPDTTPHEIPIAQLVFSYSKGTDHGTLSITQMNHAPWPPGAYTLVLRGGANGVKTSDATPIAVSPSQVFDLVAQGKDMTDPKNLGLLKAQTGSTQAAVDQGKQLNLLIAVYQQSAFPVADAHFPHQELAIATTFHIAPLVTNVTIDPARGLVPLPIDLLRDPMSGHLSALAACTLAGSQLKPDGTCPSPLAAGFLALDGFSTTGAILGPTSDLVKVSTVTANSLLLYELGASGAVQVPPTKLIIEPCEFASSCGPTALSPVIAIQPAGATAGDPTSVFRTEPLKDNTDYAVVMTTDILDKAGKPIGSGTVANVLKFTNPVNVGGHSALLGIDDATTASLEKMRSQLIPVFTALATKSIDRSKVAIAYTFHTQSITTPAVGLGALPYSKNAKPGDTTARPGAVVELPPTGTNSAFEKWGVPAGRPSSNIDEVLETDIKTFNALDPATGAFFADLGTNPDHAAEETIKVMIATPKAANPNVPACTGGLAPFGKCAPMVIFRHGLGGGRAQMLLIADSFTAAGMAVVAIDAAKHGDRSFCTSGPASATSGCNGGAACVTALPPGAQGDAHPPGACGTAGFVKRALNGAIVVPGGGAPTDGIPLVSANYLVTANFFRTRDTLRQDLIDESQLVRAIAFVPSGAPPTGNNVFDTMVQRGVIIDPAKIYYVGQSLGSIQGAADVATNPRISKAVFNVGGGTIVDVFTNSPAFAAQVDALLAGLGIQRGTAAFLQFLVVAKTILDPADPINFARHLTANTLPNLLVSPPAPQAAKKVLVQMANCDQVVPNPFGLVWASNVAFSSAPPGGPLPTGAAFFAPGATGTFQLFVGPAFNPADFGNPAKCTDTTAAGALVVNNSPSGGHGFLTSFENSLTLAAQNDAASFLMTGNPVPSVTVAQ